MKESHQPRTLIDKLITILLFPKIEVTHYSPQISTVLAMGTPNNATFWDTPTSPALSLALRGREAAPEGLQ